MKTLDLICAWGLVILGAVRCVLAILHGDWTQVGALSSLSAGTTVVAVGMLNVLRANGGKSMSRVFAIICNLLLLFVMLGLGVGLHRLLSPTPYVSVALLLVGLETIFSIVRSK
jgi:hypothetical protein